MTSQEAPKRRLEPKLYTFVCACGCGEHVTVTTVTSKPIYKHEHRFRCAQRNQCHKRKIERAKARELRKIARANALLKRVKSG